MENWWVVMLTREQMRALLRATEDDYDSDVRDARRELARREDYAALQDARAAHCDERHGLL